jgi:alanine racemase
MAQTFADKTVPLLADVPAHATGVLIVRLDAIRRNYRKLKQAARGGETAAVVKANAYGLGVDRCVPAFLQEGCRTFFVATLGEAQAVRGLAAGATIYVLDGLLPRTSAEFQAIEARPVLGSLDEIAEWATYCRERSVRLRAAIHLDTGMTRLGLAPRDAYTLAGKPDLLAAFEPSLIMSHLVCGDDAGSPKNDAQRAAFGELSALFPSVPRSLANSAGVLLGPGFHFELTRPGIALYGGQALSNAPNPMEPAVYLVGRIAQVRWAEAGETVGYGATQTLKRRTRIATVCAGYADGFFRAFSASDSREGPPGHIGRHRLPLLGRISMDLATYDATDVPDEDLHRGEWVVMLGKRVTVDDLASYAGTIGYEVLTSLGSRYHRVYVDE